MKLLIVVLAALIVTGTAGAFLTKERTFAQYWKGSGSELFIILLFVGLLFC